MSRYGAPVAVLNGPPRPLNCKRVTRANDLQLHLYCEYLDRFMMELDVARKVYRLHPELVTARNPPELSAARAELRAKEKMLLAWWKRLKASPPRREHTDAEFRKASKLFEELESPMRRRARAGRPRTARA